MVYYYPLIRKVCNEQRKQGIYKTQQNHTSWKIEGITFFGFTGYGSCFYTLLYNSQGYNASYIYIDDVSLILTPCTGIEEQNLNSNIKIYPNPLSDILNIKAWGFSEIILYDVAARKLLQQKFTNSTTVNTEQLAKGLYLYEVRNKNGLCKKGKVVKEWSGTTSRERKTADNI